MLNESVINHEQNKTYNTLNEAELTVKQVSKIRLDKMLGISTKNETI